MSLFSQGYQGMWLQVQFPPPPPLFPWKMKVRSQLNANCTVLLSLGVDVRLKSKIDQQHVGNV